MDRFVFLPSVPSRYSGCRLENYTPRTAKQRHALRVLHDVRRSGYLCEPGGIVILTGPAGTGKTHLATALLQAEAAIDSPDDGTGYISEGYLFASYSTLAREWSGQRTPDLRMLADCWLLLLDDLLPPRSESEAAALAELVDLRYRGGAMRMLVTTNMTPAEMRQALGDRTIDRLRGQALVLPLDGGSLRRPWTEADLAQLVQDERKPAPDASGEAT